MAKLKEIIGNLEQLAHPSLQESYDNSGLIIGNPDIEVTGVIVCLDSTPEVIQEAVERGCNVVIAHHPIIFSGLKKINGKNYIERTVMQAIKNDIAIYAIHTNLDNVSHGVNGEICRQLGITETRVLSPKSGILNKIVVFVPNDHKDKVLDAMFLAGAGCISDYGECSFQLDGTGSFKAGDNSKPFVGEKNVRHYEQEVRVEVIALASKRESILKAAKASHPYEEMAYDVYSLHNLTDDVGSGMIGKLIEPLSSVEFLKLLKNKMKTSVVRHTTLTTDLIHVVAVCGGSGSFLIDDAISNGADILVTADLKYHQFFDADSRIILADIGHYESEQFTIQLLHNRIAEKFTTFATHLSGVNTNPVLYF